MQLLNQRQRWATRTGIVFVGLCLVLVFAGNAGATYSRTTWVVTSTGDSGPGTLRQAIADAAPGDTIVFDANLTGATITLTSGQLVIDKNLVIDGSNAPGVTVSGGGRSRVFLVETAVTAELHLLVIADGKAPDGTIPAGAIEAQSGGGIYSSGALRLVNCTVRDSRAGNGMDDINSAPGGHGGGVYSTGSLTVENSVILHNIAGDGMQWRCFNFWCNPLPAPAEASASGGSGGGIYASGPLTVTASTVISNTAGAYGADRPQSAGGDGGGVYSLAATTIVSSTVTGNEAGGGVGCTDYWTIPGSGFCWAGRGGGLASFGQLAISDSVVSTNTAGAGAPGGDGGGVYAEGLVEVNSTVVSENSAGTGVLVYTTEPPYTPRPNGASGGKGGGIALWNGMLYLSSSLVAENLAGDGADGFTPSPNASLGHLPSVQSSGDLAGDLVYSPDRLGGNGGGGGDGGGISAIGSSILIDGATIISNRSGEGGRAGWGYAVCGYGGRGGSGAGVYAGDGSTMRIQGTTVATNRSGDGGAACEPLIEPPKPGRAGDGGGIYNGLSAVGWRNSTVSGNRTGLGPQDADDGHGGGIYINDGLTIARESTVAENVAAGSGTGGGIESAGITHLQDTLVAGNHAGAIGPDCAGNVNLLGRNLIQRPADCTLTGNVNGAILNRSALIGLRTLNAPGTTETHALLPGSPAIDAGDCAGGLITADQRGVPRPQGAACDIGAYEFDPLAADWRPLYLPLIAGQ